MGATNLCLAPGAIYPRYAYDRDVFRLKKLSRRSKSDGFKKTLSITLIKLLQCDFKCFIVISSNFTPQVKEARNQSQIFNRKSISRSTTHRQSYNLIQIDDFIAKKGNAPYSKALLQPLQWKDIPTNYKALLLSKLALSDFRGISKPFVECTLL